MIKKITAGYALQQIREQNLKQAILFANEQLDNMKQHEILSFCFDRLVEEELERLNKATDYEEASHGKVL